MGHPPDREGGQAGFDGCVCACACAGGFGGQLSHQGQTVAGERGEQDRVGLHTPSAATEGLSELSCDPGMPSGMQRERASAGAS